VVPRFYDTEGGAVLLGGHDVRRLTLASLRGALGKVKGHALRAPSPHPPPSALPTPHRVPAARQAPPRGARLPGCASSLGAADKPRCMQRSPVHPTLTRGALALTHLNAAPQTPHPAAPAPPASQQLPCTAPSPPSTMQVPQDMVLFNDTIFYNIAYGDLSATREQVRVAWQGWLCAARRGCADPTAVAPPTTQLALWPGDST
jgi:hypothetical protein